MRGRGARVARPHFITFDPRGVTKSSRAGPAPGAKCPRDPHPENAMIEIPHHDRTCLPASSPQFAATDGARWRRFLERIGTRSNDFALRLSRARFVYLHRRETSTHWLPL
jgi:hypothetical protein